MWANPVLRALCRLRRGSWVGCVGRVATLLLTVHASLLDAQGPSGGATFDTAIVKSVHLRYVIDLPSGYSATQGVWPLVLFLHGAGERGNDLAVVRSQGLPKIDPVGPVVLHSGSAQTSWASSGLPTRWAPCSIISRARSESIEHESI